MWAVRTLALCPMRPDELSGDNGVPHLHQRKPDAITDVASPEVVGVYQFRRDDFSFHSNRATQVRKAHWHDAWI